MKHQRFDDIVGRANVTPVQGVTLTRRERLQRWADLLMQEPDRPLTALRWVEFYAERERALLRDDDTPLSVAFSDPTLRASGLKNDTLGEAQRFFGLSSLEAHFLLCDCNYRGDMDGRRVARRIGAARLPTPIRQVWIRLWTA
jgi:hypothetical protein